MLIVAALEQELSGIRRILVGQARGREEGFFGANQPTIAIHAIGVGGKSAQANVKAILSSHADRPSFAPKDIQKEGLLLIGFAGAVDPALSTGDLVMSTQCQAGVQPPELRSGIKPDAALYQRALSAAAQAGLTLKEFVSVTVDHLITSVVEKQTVRQQTGAGIINMEDYWVGKAAADAGVPFLSVRAVLDTASQSLPNYLPGLASSGRKAVITTAAMPWRVPALLKLARQMRLAQSALTRFACAFLGVPYTGRPGVGEKTLPPPYWTRYR